MTQNTDIKNSLEALQFTDTYNLELPSIKFYI